MGILFEAQDLRTGSGAVLKTLSEEQQASARCRRCLKLEHQVLSRLRHPNVVKALDWIEEDGVPTLVLERIEGKDLRTRMSEGRLQVGEALEVAKGVALALQALHAQDALVHADVKPENIMIRAGEGPIRKERVVLVDFGTVLHARRASPIAFVKRLFQGPLVVGGSSLYMSPEQASPFETPIDGRADVYALGAVLYEMVAGRPPFLPASQEALPADRIGRFLESHYSEELKRKHLKETPPSPKRFAPALPEALERIVLRCLEKDPSRRFPGALELLTALTSLKVNPDGSVAATRWMESRR